MAVYRHVRTEIWINPKVSENMNNIEKLIFIYLLTNHYTTQIGIYKITKRQIAYDLNLDKSVVDEVFHKFEKQLNMITYNEKTYEIAINKWGLYNLNNSGKPLIDCIKNELERVKDIELIKVISKNIKKPKIKVIFDKAYEDRVLESSDLAYNNAYNEASTQGVQNKNENKKEHENENKKENNNDNKNKNIIPIHLRKESVKYSKPSAEDLARARALSKIN